MIQEGKLHDNHRAGLMIAFAGAFFLSFDTLLLRIISKDPMQMAFWRGVFMFLAGSVFWLSVKYLKNDLKINMINGRVGMLVSFFYGVASVSFVVSAMLTSIANMLIIIATAPFWAAILATLVLKERPSRTTLGASSVAFVGIFVVAAPGLSGGGNLGDAIALLAALSMAAAFVTSRRTKANLALAPAMGGLLSAVILLPFVGEFWLGSWRTMALMGIEGLFLVPLALGLLALAPRYLPAPQVGLFLLLETVLGPLWIWAVLAESPSVNALIGGAIVIMTLALHCTLSMRRFSGRAIAPRS